MNKTNTGITSNSACACVQYCLFSPNRVLVIRQLWFKSHDKKSFDFNHDLNQPDLNRSTLVWSHLNSRKSTMSNVLLVHLNKLMPIFGSNSVSVLIQFKTLLVDVVEKCFVISYVSGLIGTIVCVHCANNRLMPWADSTLVTVIAYHTSSHRIP